MGPARVKCLPGAQVTSYGSEEHMKISVPADSLIKIGDRLEIIPPTAAPRATCIQNSSSTKMGCSWDDGQWRVGENSNKKSALVRGDLRPPSPTRLRSKAPHPANRGARDVPARSTPKHATHPGTPTRPLSRA
ncbi:MAG: hypothetical protein JWR69_269 [Pedosphaera sp.]|nr:hypothetical protein [Pedosphaera sp.]